MFNLFKKPTQGENIKLKIKGMHCSSCAMTIDDSLEETEGVFSSETSYAAAQVRVDFNPKIVSLEKIKSIIGELGYEVIA